MDPVNTARRFITLTWPLCLTIIFASQCVYASIAAKQSSQVSRPQPLPSPEQPKGSIFFSGTDADSLASLIKPVSFATASDQTVLTLRDILYRGSQDQSGQFLATFAKANNSNSRPIITSSDRDRDLTDITNSLTLESTLELVVIAKVQAEVTATNLRFSVVSGLTKQRPGAAVPRALSTLLSRGNITLTEFSFAELPIPFGRGWSTTLHLRPYFARGGIGINFSDVSVPSSSVPWLPSTTTPGTDLTFNLEFLNKVLERVDAIKLAGGTNPSVTLKRFVASATGGQLKLAASVSDLPPEAVVDLALTWDGSPLAMRDLVIERRNCGRLINEDCVNLVVASTALAASVTNNFGGTQLIPQGKQNIALLPLRDRTIAIDGIIDSFLIENQNFSMHLRLDLARAQ